MNTVHYNVNGLNSTLTKTQVKNVLDEMDGVQKFNVDLQRVTVDVDFNEPAAECDIREKIEHVGCRITQ